ncbi:MAG: HpaII family restriction endonuclease [Candidatus Saccharimonadales bacterium]
MKSKINVPTFNKGEWSEIYAFFKILSDREVPAADSNLEPVKDKKYIFRKIFREEISGKKITYNIEQSGKVDILDENNQLVCTVYTDELSVKTMRIFSRIAGGKKTFEVPELFDLMQGYFVTKIKAKSTQKADLVALVEDPANVLEEKSGFSIKSHVGSPPTLVNGSGQTNFIFEVRGFTSDIEAVNSINTGSKIKDRVKQIYAQGGSLQYVGMTSDTYRGNLRLIDTAFPSLLGAMLVAFFKGEGITCKELCRAVSNREDDEISESELLFKMSLFLRASALGMIPSEPWNTRSAANGGYIIVRPDGELLCYSLLRDDDFREYLLAKTKFDTASSRNHFGLLYMEDDRVLFKLNLDIRFLK